MSRLTVSIATAMLWRSSTHAHEIAPAAHCREMIADETFCASKSLRLMAMPGGSAFAPDRVARNGDIIMGQDANQRRAVTPRRLPESEQSCNALDTSRIGEAVLAKDRQSRGARDPAPPAPLSLGLDQRVSEIERRLAPANEPPSVVEVSDEALAVIAARIYQSRLRRDRHLPGEFLGEPAWEILLDLFVAAVRGKAVRTCSACHASGSPLTTALRWLALLESRGLVERHTEFGDHRVKLVRLSQEGFKAMRAYLLAGVAAGEFSFGDLT